MINCDTVAVPNALSYSLIFNLNKWELQSATVPLTSTLGASVCTVLYVGRKESERNSLVNDDVTCKEEKGRSRDWLCFLVDRVAPKLSTTLPHWHWFLLNSFNPTNDRLIAACEWVIAVSWLLLRLDYIRKSWAVVRCHWHLSCHTFTIISGQEKGGSNQRLMLSTCWMMQSRARPEGEPRKWFYFIFQDFWILCCGKRRRIISLSLS